MNPRVFKQGGLKHLDRVVDLVSEIPPLSVHLNPMDPAVRRMLTFGSAQNTAYTP